MERFKRDAPIILINEMIPVRDHVVDRTAVMAKWNAAVHAPRGLLFHGIGGQRFDELVPVLQPRFGLFIAAITAFNLKESSGFTHHSSPARGRYSAATEAAASRRSEEHTSELQSLMRISYAVFCLKKTNNNTIHNR